MLFFPASLVHTDSSRFLTFLSSAPPLHCFASLSAYKNKRFPRCPRLQEHPHMPSLFSSFPLSAPPHCTELPRYFLSKLRFFLSFFFFFKGPFCGFFLSFFCFLFRFLHLFCFFFQLFLLALNNII